MCCPFRYVFLFLLIIKNVTGDMFDISTIHHQTERYLRHLSNGEEVMNEDEENDSVPTPPTTSDSPSSSTVLSSSPYFSSPLHFSPIPVPVVKTHILAISADTSGIWSKKGLFKALSRLYAILLSDHNIVAMCPNYCILILVNSITYILEMYCCSPYSIQLLNGAL